MIQYTKQIFELIDNKYILINTVTEIVTNEFKNNWINSIKFFKSINGQEYRRNGKFYSISPCGQIKNIVTFK